jgi:hypothetical protein
MDKKIQKPVAKMSVHKPNAKMVAAATNTSENTVYAFRKGHRVTGKKAKKIAVAEEMLGKGMNNLVEAVRQAVNF